LKEELKKEFKKIIEIERKEMIFRLLDQGCDMKTITAATQLSEKEIMKIIMKKNNIRKHTWDRDLSHFLFNN
jgi:Mor family transcriptional regulator